MKRDSPRRNDRIVFVTQAYAPSETLLGVTADWVQALGTRFAGVDVIAQRAPEAPRLLPRARTALRVASMGKDRGVGRVGQSAALVASIARAARRARAIFVHMVPRYVLLVAPIARLAGVPIILWYAHGTADRALRMAVPFVNRVVTPTRDSFPLAGRGVDGKVRVTGHGIDEMRHAPGATVAEPGLVLSAGRLSPVKRHELAIEAVVGGPVGSRLVIAGSPLHDGDVAYRDRLVSQSASERDQHPQFSRTSPSAQVSFVGDVPFEEMPATYRRAWVLAHASRTGSLDKVVLEAAACGTLVVSSAPSSRAVLDAVPGLSVPDGDDEAFVARVREVLGWSVARRAAAGQALRLAVVTGHSLDHWADRVTSAIREVG